MWLPTPTISTESPSNRKFKNLTTFYPFLTTFPSSGLDSHIFFAFWGLESLQTFHEITEFFTKLSIEVLWNSSWPWSDSRSSSEDSATSSSSSLSLSALLSSWLLVLFPRRLSLQCTVVGLKVRKVLQFNLATTVNIGDKKGGCCKEVAVVERLKQESVYGFLSTGAELLKAWLALTIG